MNSKTHCDLGKKENPSVHIVYYVLCKKEKGDYIHGFVFFFGIDIDRGMCVSCKIELQQG